MREKGAKMPKSLCERDALPTELRPQPVTQRAIGDCFGSQKHAPIPSATNSTLNPPKHVREKRQLHTKPAGSVLESPCTQRNGLCGPTDSRQAERARRRRQRRTCDGTPCAVCVGITITSIGRTIRVAHDAALGWNAPIDDREGPQRRHRIVRDARCRLAGAEGSSSLSVLNGTAGQHAAKGV